MSMQPLTRRRRAPRGSGMHLHDEILDAATQLLLETGHVLPRAPWEMHAELRAAQMARNDGS